MFLINREDMNKVIQRLLTFFIGIPVILGAIFFDPTDSHFIINVIVCAASFLSSIELYKLFSCKTPLTHKYLIVILSTILPVSGTFLILFGKDRHYIDYTNWIFIFSAMIIMAEEIFSNKTFKESNLKVSSAVFIILYTGLLFTFIQRITLFKESKFLLSLFLLTVFINDSAAWFFGVLFGKNNRGLIAASPNKSAAGFSGGCLVSILTCVIAQKNWPEILTGSLYKSVLLGFLCSLSGITGDLIESVFKRSADIKDSGNIIPGRGGVLDSVDSILFTAPVFYILTFILFNPEFIK